MAGAFDAAIRDGTLRGGVPGCAGGFGFEQVAAHWLATKQATKRPRTVAVYRSELYTHVLPVFGAMGLAQIERRDVQAWVNSLLVSGLGAASVRHVYRTVFKAELNDAVADGLLARSPCHRIELPAVNRIETEPLTAAQVRGIAARVSVTFAPMVLLGGACGLRWGEAAGLTADRLHLDGQCPWVRIDRQLAQPGNAGLFAPPKTASSVRSVPLPTFLATMLRAHVEAGLCAERGLLFTTTVGTRLLAGNWRRRVWKPAVYAAEGVPESATFHQLRHGYASLLYDAHRPPGEIQRYLGHAGLGQTLHYSHPYPEDAHAARTALDQAFRAEQGDR